MSGLFDEIHELLSFITFPIKKASEINIFGIQVKISIVHIQVVSPNLRTLNKIIHLMKYYYIQKFHNLKYHITSCTNIFISLKHAV